MFAVCLAAMAISSPAEAGADRRPSRLELLVLDAEGVDAAAYEEALDVRLPSHARVAARSPGPRPPAESWAYVSIRPSVGGWTLLLILDDGRGYERSVARGSDGDEARMLATSTANLVAGIEHDTILADETDMVAPEPEPVAAQIVPPGAGLRPGAAEPMVTAIPPISPPLEPVDPRVEVPGPRPPTDGAPPSLPPRRDPLSWGLGIQGFAGWGVAPLSTAGFAGGGGAASLAAVVRGSILVGADVRFRAERSEPFTSLRTRVGVHAGYRLRRGRFEFRAVVGPTLEPWWVRSSRQRTTLRGPNRTHEAGLNLGGAARAFAGTRFQLGWAELSIGPVVECSASSVATGGGGAATVQSQTNASTQTLFVVGGLEITTGIEVRVWWDRKPR